MPSDPCEQGLLARTLVPPREETRKWLYDPPRAELHQFAAELLKIDLALIEENETHVVISLRVPRQYIARNHDFLAVLSDLAGGVASAAARK